MKVSPMLHVTKINMLNIYDDNILGLGKKHLWQSDDTSHIAIIRNSLSSVLQTYCFEMDVE